VVLFFREPSKSGEVRTESLSVTMRNFGQVVMNPKFMVFLLIFTGYWIVYWQEFITLPIYVHDYVDANYYGGFIDDVTFKFFDASSVADVAYANAAQSAIHAYLEQGHARIAFYHAVYDRLAREFPSMSIFEFADYVRAREDNDVEEFRNRITTP